MIARTLLIALAATAGATAIFTAVDPFKDADPTMAENRSDYPDDQVRSAVPPPLSDSVSVPARSISRPSAGSVDPRGLPSLNSRAGLERYLARAREPGFDIRPISEYAERSQAGFDQVVNAYREAVDKEVRKILQRALAATNRPGTYELSLDLLDSPELQDRRDGYSLLTQSGERNRPEVNDALIVASYYEEDPGTLIGLISSFSTLGTADPQVSGNVQNRLRELAVHESPGVATEAISTLSKLSQDGETLAVLKSHLYGPSERMQLAALNGLHYFQKPDAALIAEIEAVANSPQASGAVRGAASDAVQLMKEVAALDATGAQ